MTEKEFTESMGYLGLAYNKEFTKEEIMQYYDFLRDYSDITFTQAIKNIIRKSKFLPKITELIDECESCKIKNRYDVITYMIDQNYFKDDSEIEKAQRWLETNNIPSWFKPVLNEYYRKMTAARIEGSKQKLIEA